MAGSAGLTLPVSSLTQEHIEAVVEGRLQEGLMLEFKRGLLLKSATDKREAAKDVAALANTAGGRILYGVGEDGSPGSAVAGAITPLSDGHGLRARLLDTLYGNIHPRPRLDASVIEIKAPGGQGQVIALDVLPSQFVDVHVVNGWDAPRYYRRGPTGAILMNEPEVRDAYFRAASARQQLELHVDDLARRARGVTAGAEEAIVVVPWLRRTSIVEPREFPNLGSDIQQAFPWMQGAERFPEMIIFGGGFRLQVGATHLSVSRAGVIHRSHGSVHWARHTALLDPISVLRRIGETLLLAGFVLNRAGYNAPVSVRYFLTPQVPTTLNLKGLSSVIPAAPIESEINEAYLTPPWDLDVLARELMDPICHAAGLSRCPLFDLSGRLEPGYRDDATLVPLVRYLAD